MTRRQLYLCCVAVGLLCGCRSISPKANPGILATKLGTNAFTSVSPLSGIQKEWLSPSVDFFRLGPGDIIDIETIGVKEIPATTMVGPDGKLYYSLLPGLFVWGLSLSEARELIETQMAKYLRDRPEIGLTLKSVGSRRIWILGSVASPGVYSLATPVTLLEGIAAAGGIAQASGGNTETADLTKSFVLRHGKPIAVDLKKLLHDGDLSQNIYLQADDFVYLRPATTKEVYVLGAVATPNIVPFTTRMSLATAIAYTGGPAKYASLSHVAVVRGSITQPSIATVNFHHVLEGQLPDIELEPGDLVFVPRSPFVGLEIFADSILTTFVQTIAVNEGRAAVVPTSPAVGVSVPISH
ncbi:MAG TPA: SLBB domain-containing protein [Candidatus Binatia bacterium]|nr:SLBB domain-containing protein [Candidatus Binatia bacterium]